MAGLLTAVVTFAVGVLAGTLAIYLAAGFILD